MALSQIFTKKCSVSSPSCTNSINSCSVTSCTQYCNTNVCSTSGYCNNNDSYTNSYYCNQCSEYTDYYEKSNSYKNTNTCSVYCPTYNDSCYMDDGQSEGYRNDIYGNYKNNCTDTYDNSCYNVSYKEYYDYANNKHNSYSNYSEYRYYDYSNQYHNSSYYEYGNYKNSNNYCSTKWTYSNYADAYATKLGGSYTPSWTNSVPVTDSYISGTFIKELRDKVKQLSTSKQRNQVNDSNVQSGSGLSADSNLNNYIRSDNLGIENIRATLCSIYLELGQTDPGIGSIEDGAKMTPSALSSIKSAIDTLAEKDISSGYVNYLNSSYSNSSASYVNMSNIPSSIITYSNYSNASYTNSIAYVNYSESTATIGYKNSGTYKNS